MHPRSRLSELRALFPEQINVSFYAPLPLRSVLDFLVAASEGRIEIASDLKDSVQLDSNIFPMLDLPPLKVLERLTAHHGLRYQLQGTQVWLHLAQ